MQLRQHIPVSARVWFSGNRTWIVSKIYFFWDQTETNTVLNWVEEFFLSHCYCYDSHSMFTAVAHVCRSGLFACNSQKASLYTGCAAELLQRHLRLGLETAGGDAAWGVCSGVVMEINIKEKKTFCLYTRVKHEHNINICLKPIWPVVY